MNNDMLDESLISEEDDLSDSSTVQNLEGECKTDAEKILKNLKQFNTSSNDYLKKNIINAIPSKTNLFTSTQDHPLAYNKEVNDDEIVRDSMGEVHIDCLSLIEDICLKINKIVIKYGLEKYKLDSNNIKLISEIASSDEYDKIRRIINTLPFLDLKTLSFIEEQEHSIQDVHNLSHTNINEERKSNAMNVPNVNLKMSHTQDEILIKSSSRNLPNLNNTHNQNNNVNVNNNNNNSNTNINNSAVNKNLTSTFNYISVGNNSSSNNNNLELVNFKLTQKKNKAIEFKMKMKISFWLNLYNYLVIYTIFNKKEYLSTLFEWNKLLKNSYYDIGGLVISLFEIEHYILRQTDETTKFTDNFSKLIQAKAEFTDVLMQDKQSNERLKFLKFGISYPINSSPTLRVYFPINLEERLKVNAYEFLSKNINIDIEQGIIFIPELLTSIDDAFKENINNYTE